MPFQLSPGVNVSETDLTNIIPSVSTSGGGFVGEFLWGPVSDYTIVSDKGRLEAIFGKPSDKNFVDWFSASNFLAYSNNLNLIRVVDESNALNSTADGLGALIKNSSHYDLVAPTIRSTVFSAKYPGDLGNALEVHIADNNSFTGWEYADNFDNAPNTSDWAVSKGAPNAKDELHVIVVDKTGAFSGTPGSILERFQSVSKGKDAKTLDGKPNFYGNVINNESQYIWYTGAPLASSYLPEGALTSLTIDNAGAGFTSTPAVTVVGDGVDAAVSVTLSATGEVSAINITDGGTGYDVGDVITISGDGVGATAEVSSVAAGVIDGITITNGGTGYTTATADISLLGNNDAILDAVVTYSLASVAIDDAGMNYTTIELFVDEPVVGTNPAVISATISPTGDDWGQIITPDTEFKNLAITEYALSGGSDGSAVTANELIAGWDLFSNAEVVDVSLLFSGNAGGQASSGAVIQHIIDNICETRKDVILFYSPDFSDVFNLTPEQANENIINFRTTKINRRSSYAVMDSGYKSQYDAVNDVYRWLPLNADFAGLAARTDEIADPWYSPAGLTRGQIKNVVTLAHNPNKTQRDQLYKNHINPIVSLVGEGVVLWGDRTTLNGSAAFSKINIRRLFIVLEKAIAKAARLQLFEFNDEFTRSLFRNSVEPFLLEVQARRGLTDFSVICDESNNTPEIIDRSEFVAEIYIKPTFSINSIQLNFIATRTGVSFEEVVGSV